MFRKDHLETGGAKTNIPSEKAAMQRRDEAMGMERSEWISEQSGR